MIGRVILMLLSAALFGQAAEDYTWWIDPAGDVELARWAFDAWQRESNGAVVFHKADSQAHARLQLVWAGGADGLYGETRPMMVDGKPGALIYVLPTANPDRLLQDAIVYLTCVHEIGHALGLRHTDKFEDIMYTFSLGGNIQEYFGRYRRQLKSRSDIPKHSGLSEADKAAIR